MDNTENKLDRSSTDALHWAEHFCMELIRVSRGNVHLDVGWVQGWFANYWAATHDPLQAKIDDLQERMERVKPIKVTFEVEDQVRDDN